MKIRAFFIFLYFWFSIVSGAPKPLTGFRENGLIDYAPSVAVDGENRIHVVFERLSEENLYGDIYTISSMDGGATWSLEKAIFSTDASERAPSLISLNDGSLLLAYSSKATGKPANIHLGRYSIEKGEWKNLGQIELGWKEENLVNPCLFSLKNGDIALVYQVLTSGGSNLGVFFSISSDGGKRWDKLRKRVSKNGRVPRGISLRDGRIFIVYQAGEKGSLAIYGVFCEKDGERWTEPVLISKTEAGEEAKDGFPFESEDGKVYVFYVRHTKKGNRIINVSHFNNVLEKWESKSIPEILELNKCAQPHAVVSPKGIYLVFSMENEDGYNIYFQEIVEGIVKVKKKDKKEVLSLGESFPNPFSLETSIGFSLLKPASITLRIFNFQGGLIKTLLDEEKSVGEHRVVWDGKNERGEKVPSGVYFYKLESKEGYSETKRILLVR